MKKPKVQFDQVIERGCGIGVYEKSLVATIQGVGIKEETREYSNYTSSIESLCLWLKENDIVYVAMERIGVYWKPIYNVLGASFDIILVNAHHVKHVFGREADSKCLTKLLLSGLLKGNSIPARSTRELRYLIRYRRTLVDSIWLEKNRLQKILEDADAKLSAVLKSTSSSIMSKIIKALLKEQEDISELVKYHTAKAKLSKEELGIALQAALSDYDRLLLTMIKRSMKEKELLELLVEKLDNRIEEHLQIYETSMILFNHNITQVND